MLRFGCTIFNPAQRSRSSLKNRSKSAQGLCKSSKDGGIPNQQWRCRCAKSRNMGRIVGKKHALILPVSLHAHFFGLYRHAVELAKKGVTITLVAEEAEIAPLKTYEELRGLDFNAISYQDFGCEKIVSLGHPVLDLLEFLPKWKSRIQPVFKKLMADKKAGLSGPTCIIADRFLVWALDMGKELKIPYYQFFSCGATYVRALQAFVPLLADGTMTYKTAPSGAQYLAEFEGYFKISGLSAIAYRDMPNPPPTDTKAFLPQLDLGIGIGVGKADAVIVNSFYELEAPQIDAIQQFWKEDPQGNIPKLYLVGPISVATNFKDRSLLADLRNRGTDCLQWLDEQPRQSVVYIAIGSIALFFPHQIRAIALALEASEQSFLWVLKSGEEHLPTNFATRMRGKGLIVSGWVPQLQILRHSSTGGFVTHCGWNSIIESITSGVPMAAWPQMNNDQFINCRHLVDVLKVAIEVRIESLNSSTWWMNVTSSSTSPEKCGEFEAAVRLLLSEEGNVLRARVQDLKKKAEAAVADGGASKNALQYLVESIPS